MTTKLEQHRIDHIKLGLNTWIYGVGEAPLTESNNILYFNYDSSDFGILNNNLYIKDSGINHSNIQNIGTYLHTEIDNHIDDLTIHFTEASIDHGSISGLLDDDHSQYLLLAGRSGGQTSIGGTAAGDDLTLQSTSNATKGSILFGTSAYDEVNNRLGIGTDSPSYILHTKFSIAGANGLILDNDSTDASARSRIQFYCGNDANGYMDLTEGSNWLTYNAENNVGYFTWYTQTSSSATEKMRLDNSGRLGIGESSPDVNLHITSSGDAAIKLEADTDDSGEGDNAYILFSQDGDAVKGEIGLNNSTTTSPSGAAFTNNLANSLTITSTTSNSALVLGTDSTMAITIDTSQNVGIGTSSPATDLHITDDTDTSTNWWSNANVSLLLSNSTGEASVIKFEEATGRIVYGDASGNDILIFSSRQSEDTANEVIVFNNNGQVGIGTSSPAVSLDVNADSIRIRTSQSPASNGTGTQGEIAWDSDYLYVCYNTDSWGRILLTKGY